MTYLDTPLAEGSIEDFVTLAPDEDPDWGYARNKATALMAPSAEWVQSVFSCKFEMNGKHFFTPNRDFQYQGLQVYQGAENWKLIDCIAIALHRKDGAEVNVYPHPKAGVRATPWRATYHYLVRTGTDQGAVEIPLDVSYYLCSQNTPRLISGCVELHFPHGVVAGGAELISTIQPFVDIRHMYHESDFNNVQVQDLVQDGHRLVRLSKHIRSLTFYLPSEEFNCFDQPEVTNWFYKLGSGSRIEVFNPQRGRSETRFEGSSRSIAAYFNFDVSHRTSGPAVTSGRFVRLFWSSTLEEDADQFTLADVERSFEASRRTDEQQYREIQKVFPSKASLPLRAAIWGRAAGLTRYKLHTQYPDTNQYAAIPPAGSWWFRTPWFRDVFEGILFSFTTLMALPGENETIKNAVLLALTGYNKETGRIFNKIDEHKDRGGTYDSADATLLCFITANRYIRHTQDLEFARKVLPYVQNTIACFCCDPVRPDRLILIDGAPRIEPKTSLLLCVPRHSWTDTSVQILHFRGFRATDLPNRVSHAFLCDLFHHIQGKRTLSAVLASPNFFLPEINAQWLMMLAGLVETYEFVRGDAASRDAGQLAEFETMAQNLYRHALENFKRVFWNDKKGYLHNAVYYDLEVSDAIESEAGVTAAAMLGEAAFTREELRRVWQCARDKLLVNRRSTLYGNDSLPFGLLTKNEGPKPFYNDNQYHSDVVWPRSTPYLLQLLEAIGEMGVIEEILINNLDHQMSEGAVFYNHELFSRPVGNNPDPGHETSKNPVPVKNPIQFWSQWCDAYIVHLSHLDNR